MVRQEINASADFDCGMIGEYVIVRSHDAGIHCGVLRNQHQRMCVLDDARYIYDWIPEKGKSLSGVATHGVSVRSRIAAPIARLCLTEDCQIMLCSEAAEKSLREIEELPEAP